MDEKHEKGNVGCGRPGTCADHRVVCFLLGTSGEKGCHGKYQCERAGAADLFCANREKADSLYL